MSPPLRYNVLGTGVSAVSLETTRDLVLAAHGQKRLGYVCFAGVHGVSEARRDPAFRRILNDAWLNVPDGMPLVWLGWLHGHRKVTRVYGPDLMAAVCDAGRASGLKHYFYGGQPGIAEELSRRLTARFPGLQVVGTFTPPFRDLTPGEFAALQADIAAKAPDLVWIGVSSPKQERFAARAAPHLDAALLLAVGAAFDFHSGRVRQAPRWLQQSGFEWLFRLCMEPRRLWKRYLLNNPVFLVRIFLQLTGLRRYPVEREETRAE